LLSLHGFDIRIGIHKKRIFPPQDLRGFQNLEGLKNPFLSLIRVAKRGFCFRKTFEVLKTSKVCNSQFKKGDMMTYLLEQAFAKASKLPEEEQNILARRLLEEFASEKRWDRLFSESQDLLSELADEALAEFEQGRTELLEPEKL
jgi:hypothetical protein